MRVKVVKRMGPKKESYILVASPSDSVCKYWVGCTELQSTSYLEVMNKIKMAVEAGDITSKSEAVEMKASLLLELKP